MSKYNEAKLVTAWESYGHRDNEYTLWNTQDRAENHELYEIEFVTESNVYLFDDEIERFNRGLPVFG